MTWSNKYVQNSLFYEAWKTKFIEVFSREYPILLKNFYKADKNDLNALFTNTSHYNSIFKTVLKILKKKLINDGYNDITFYSDVVYQSYKNKLISNIELWQETVQFLTSCANDKKYFLNFKPEYLTILEDFKNRLKPYIKNTGFKDKNYTICDNTYCLWGISEQSYKKITEVFLSFEDLKIVRITGSRVTQNYRKFSDIDLISEGTYSTGTYNIIYDILLSLNIPYIIDMNDIYKGTKPFIYRNIVRSNIFYNRKDYFPDDKYKSIFE